jgi:hypothetical protein
VSAKSFAGLNPAPGDAGHDRAGAAFGPAAAVIIRFIGVKLVRPASWPPLTMANARRRIEGWSQHGAVVVVGAARAQAERRALAIDHKMAPQTRFAAIRRVRSGLGAPFFAATDVLSSEARLQSSRPAPARCFRSTRCSCAQTPASCQSRNLRQQVMPEQPISRGGISQGTPERRTKMMPDRVARSSHPGRPPNGLLRT